MINVDKKAAAHKKACQQMAEAAMRGNPPWTGPVMMSVVAVFSIPPSWPKYLRTQAATGSVPHVTKPDLDNIAKQLKDACKGIIYDDDAQVCSFTPPFSKRYGSPARTEVSFFLLPQQEAAVTPGQRRLERDQGSALRRPLSAKKPV